MYKVLRSDTSFQKYQLTSLYCVLLLVGAGAANDANCDDNNCNGALVFQTSYD